MNSLQWIVVVAVLVAVVLLVVLNKRGKKEGDDSVASNTPGQVEQPAQQDQPQVEQSQDSTDKPPETHSH